MRGKSKANATLVQELATALGSSVFLGFGVLFLMLWAGIWV